ncbi:hypothetical protein EA473_21100 [Natrarchaeobius chitinivorans]|uniref:Uncharacterized protein n=1 Tax=Natrarchaeobius chitinivorans TaxID=1679083 RepID=A0A3N6MA51_NATCH|nr:hypothetical protein EA473_21100 [Natrarchaeobius chitinivorans]
MRGASVVSASKMRAAKPRAQRTIEGTKELAFRWFGGGDPVVFSERTEASNSVFPLDADILTAQQPRNRRIR